MRASWSDCKYLAVLLLLCSGVTYMWIGKLEVVTICLIWCSPFRCAYRFWQSNWLVSQSTGTLATYHVTSLPQLGCWEGWQVDGKAIGRARHGIVQFIVEQTECICLIWSDSLPYLHQIGMYTSQCGWAGDWSGRQKVMQSDLLSGRAKR